MLFDVRQSAHRRLVGIVGIFLVGPFFLDLGLFVDRSCPGAPKHAAHTAHGACIRSAAAPSAIKSEDGIRFAFSSRWTVGSEVRGKCMVIYRMSIRKRRYYHTAAPMSARIVSRQVRGAV